MIVWTGQIYAYIARSSDFAINIYAIRLWNVKANIRPFKVNIQELSGYIGCWLGFGLPLYMMMVKHQRTSRTLCWLNGCVGEWFGEKIKWWSESRALNHLVWIVYPVFWKLCSIIFECWHLNKRAFLFKYIYTHWIGWVCSAYWHWEYIKTLT